MVDPLAAGLTETVRNLTGAEMMASVWPSIEDASVNWPAVESLGLVSPTANMMDIAGYWLGKYVHMMDSTNPGAREFLWQTLKRNYYDKGIRNFWLDEDEGGQVAVDSFPWTDFYLGPDKQYALLYPYMHQMGVFHGQMNVNGSSNVTAVSLSRSSWAGSQRFASAVWSGDI